MKKSLLFAGAIFLMSGIAIAETIGFDTQIKWNTKVIEEALKRTGFKPSSSVEFVYKAILKALLEQNTFSARQAVEVCMDECNKSEMLKEGRGNSRKKCPQLCEEFASSLVIANNEANNALLSGDTEYKKVDSVPVFSWRGAGYIIDSHDIKNDVIMTFKEDEYSSEEFCTILAADAFKRGVRYPMTCSGKCYFLGNDIVKVSGDGGTKYYEVGDFCDGLFEGAGEYYIRVHYDGTIEN